MQRTNILSVSVCAVLTAVAGAHDGRRLEIIVLPSGQLAAQGYISDGVDDGGGVTRPYLNCIHGHWENSPLPGERAASADLPGFDLFEPGPLAGHGLTLTLTGASKWIPTDPADPDTLVEYPLPAEQTVYVGDGNDFSDTVSGGTFTLSGGVPAVGLPDVDLTYDIADRPAGYLVSLRFTLASSAPGLSPSETVNVILAPDGADPGERMHVFALRLESVLGVRPCPADFNGDGAGGDIFDLFDFLSALEAGIDFNGDGAESDVFDLFDFLTVLDAGCP